MGRGGRTITVGRQGPQKFFQVPKSLENFLLSAPLQPLTANCYCAHGGQPKSPRPISAGRHVFILEPGYVPEEGAEHGKNYIQDPESCHEKIYLGSHFRHRISHKSCVSSFPYRSSNLAGALYAKV